MIHFYTKKKIYRYENTILAKVSMYQLDLSILLGKRNQWKNVSTVHGPVFNLYIFALIFVVFTLTKNCLSYYCFSQPSQYFSRPPPYLSTELFGNFYTRHFFFSFFFYFYKSWFSFFIQISNVNSCAGGVCFYLTMRLSISPLD